LRPRGGRRGLASRAPPGSIPPRGGWGGLGGGRGPPPHGWAVVRAFSQALADHLAATIPERFSAKSGAGHRIGKVFVDCLRNGFGATTASAWSVRARPGLGVSVPVAWDELPSLTGGAHWTLRSIDARPSVGNAPWADMERSRKGLAAAMKRVGFRPASVAD